MNLDGSTVCVVTGAGSGIGQALALALAERGCRLALVDYDEVGAEATAAEIDLPTGSVSVHVADVGDRERMAALPAEVVDRHGGVNLLINNAGVTSAGSFAEQTIDDFEWVVRTNLLGVAYGCKFFMEHLEVAPTAHIANISSAAGFAGIPGQVAYCTSKFGVYGMSEALRAELRNRGIGVTSIHPGAIRTNIARSMRTTDDQLKDKVVAGIGRFGMRADKVAQRILATIERNRARLVIGPDAQVIWWSKRLAPRLLSGVLGRLYRDG